MRKYIDLIETALNEGVEFEPRIKEIRDGKVYISQPDEHIHQEEKECWVCDGTGLDKYYGQFHDDTRPCGMCDGRKTNKEWVYDYPRMRVNHMQISTLCDMLGREYDYAGYIAPEELPELRRNLIRILNGGADDYVTPDTDEQKTIVDRSGDVPEIKRGARMIGSGLDTHAIEAGARKFIEIIDWAQKHGTGVGWA